MRGLIVADWLAYRRRMGIVSMYFSYLVCVVCFLVWPETIALSLITLVILPMGMANLPVVLKEIDSGQAYCRYLLTLPCGKRDIVRARFAASLLDGLQDMGLALVFILVHAAWKHMYSWAEYLQLWLGCVMIGISYMAVNLLVSFAGNVMVSSVFYMISLLAGVGIYLVVFLLDVPVERILSASPVVLWLAAGMVTVGILAACYGISLRIFGRRSVA